MDNYPVFFLLLPPGLGTPSWHSGVLGASIMLLSESCTPAWTLKKLCVVLCGGVVVVHRILLTAHRPKSPFLFLDLSFMVFGHRLWTGTWPQACQLWRPLFKGAGESRLFSNSKLSQSLILPSRQCWRPVWIRGWRRVLKDPGGCRTKISIIFKIFNPILNFICV